MKYILHLLLGCFVFPIHFLIGQKDSTFPVKYKFNISSQVMIKNTDWQIDKVNQMFNLPKINKVVFLANIGTFIYYKNILINPALSLGSEPGMKVTTFQSNVTAGYNLFSLTNTNKIFLNLKYKYAAFQYNLDYLSKGTSISVGTSNFNGGTLRLFNTSSLVGISILSTHFDKRRSFYNNVEMAYFIGIGPNRWHSNTYHFVSPISLSETFSFLEILISL